MKLFKKTVVASMIALSGSAFAGTMGPTATNPPRLYVGVQVGDSISTDTHFQPRIRYPLAERYAFVTPVNTDFTRDFGSEAFVGAFIGYNWTPNLALQFSYDYRNGYDWNILTAEDNSFAAPDVFDRYNVKSTRIQTFLFDMVLKPSVNWGGFVPYVKGGIGIANNRIKGLQNIDIPIGRSTPLSFDTHVSGKSTTNFAWDAGVGVDYFVNEKFSLGLGYRLVDVGSLKTGSTFTDSTGSATALPFTISPFETKHLFLNEVSISAAYHFDYA